MTDIVYNAEPTLAAFHASNAFIRGVMGPVGSGKSVAMCIEILNKAIGQHPQSDNIRRSRWGVIRNTYIELKSTTIKTWMDWIPDVCNKMKWDSPISSMVKFPLGDGTEVELEVLFISLDNPRDIKKLKSMELTGVFINEACEEPKAVLDMAASRVGRYPSKKDGGSAWSGVIMDTNAMDTDHWWHTLAEHDTTTERGRKLWAELQSAESVMREVGLLPDGQPLMEFFSQPPALLHFDGKWIPNPKAENITNLDDGFAYYLRQVAGKTYEWINTFLAGNYGKVVDGKPVYPEYSSHVHAPGISLTYDPDRTIIIGLDYGLTPAAAICQMSQRGQFLILGEVVSENMGIRRFLSDALKPYLAENFPDCKFKIYCDPNNQRSQSNEDKCIDEVRAAGFDVENAKTNHFLPRREAVAFFLNRMVDGEPGLLVDMSCQYISKGMAGAYNLRRVQVLGEERYKNEPEDNIYTHVADAVQYAALSVGSVGEAQRLKDERPEWVRNIVRPTRSFMAR